MASPIGLQQLISAQGIEWGDGAGQRTLWFDGGVLNTDATFNLGAISFGSMTLTDAQSKIVPGATSILFRNHADTITNMSLTDVGALTVTGQDGSGSGVVGTAHLFTTGAGGGGNARGGDFTVNLGAATGTKRGGILAVNSTQTAPESDVTPGVYIQTAYTPSQAGSSVQAIQATLTTSGNGALVTGPSVAAAELAHVYTATGTLGAGIIYGAESQMLLNHASGTVGNATGMQGNIRGTGAGTLTAGSAFRASIGAFTGPVTTMSAITLGPADLSGNALGIINYRGLIANDTYNTSGGSHVNGSYSCVNVLCCVPSQGGNTSGTNTNYAFEASITQPNAGGGVPGVNGTCLNYAVKTVTPTAAGPGSGTGRTYNVALHISGNGNAGTQGAGFANDTSIANTSTAPSFYNGRVGIGSTFSTATAPATTSLLHVVGTQTVSSGAGSVLKALQVAASTITMSGATGVTTATGFNLVEFAQPTITNGSGQTITNSATMAIMGPPIAGGSVTITNAASLWVAANVTTVAAGSLSPAIAIGTSGTAPLLGIYWGSGAPTISAPQGSLYFRTDGSSTSTRAYINTTGSTTWTAITTAA